MTASEQSFEHLPWYAVTKTDSSGGRYVERQLLYSSQPRPNEYVDDMIVQPEQIWDFVMDYVSQHAQRSGVVGS